MLQTIEDIFLSRHPLSGIVYLILGAIVGAIASVVYSIRAQKPRLIIAGAGGGGNQQHLRWSINISNRPSFFGLYLDGEAARDVTALLRVNESSAQYHMLYWGVEPRERSVTLEAGRQEPLALFNWWPGAPGGYVIVDHAGAPVARFHGRRLGFVLRLNDRLGRSTDIPFTVEFDDSHLQNPPHLTINLPITFRMRLERLRNAMQQIRLAFKRY